MVSNSVALIWLYCIICIGNWALGARIPRYENIRSSEHGRPFAFFYFVRQWPGTFCSGEGRCAEAESPVKGRFGIHGLWPNYKDDTWPQFCDNSRPYDPSSISAETKGAMEREWPSLTGQNDEFWAHEWSKHGTCSWPVVRSEQEYFATAISLNERFDVNAALEAQGVDLDAGAMLETSELVRMLRGAFGVTPILDCDDGQLLQVFMCVGRDLKPFNCSPKHAALLAADGRLGEGACGPSVALPALCPEAAAARGASSNKVCPA